MCVCLPHEQHVNRKDLITCLLYLLCVRMRKNAVHRQIKATASSDMKDGGEGSAKLDRNENPESKSKQFSVSTDPSVRVLMYFCMCECGCSCSTCSNTRETGRNVFGKHGRR